MNEIPLVGETKTKILQELFGSRKTAGEIADSIGIQVSAVRKHLEALLSAGIVVQQFVRGEIGRPKKFYSLSELGRELFPRQYELVLNTLVEKLIASTDRNFVDSLLRRVASDLVHGKLFEVETPSVENDSFEAKVERLNNSMSKFGFDTSVEDWDSNFIRLVSHNCPFYKAAKRFPDLMCQGLHGEIIRSALNTEKVKLEGCLLSGDSKCVHSVERGSAKRVI